MLAAPAAPAAPVELVDGGRRAMKGGIEALREMIAADPDRAGAMELAPKRRPEHYEFYLAGNLKKWQEMRTLATDGHCAKLVQFATGAPLTRFWLRGPRVKRNMKIPKGTAIAVFDADGFYSDGTHPRHAAIYLGQTAKGVQVLDQWVGKDVATWGFARTLGYGTARNGWTVNDGDHFHVVLSARYTEWDWGMGAAAAGSVTW